MTRQIRIILTPLEPYFFGGERTFGISGENKQYFIQSLDVPGQATLFGALRFIGIANPAKGKWLSDNDEDGNDIANIGAHSFKLTEPGYGEEDGENAGFGRIQKISPLYLTDADGRLYCRTPFDHDQVNLSYNPWNYYKEVNTELGVRKLPGNYLAKLSLADSWVCLKEDALGTLKKNLITTVVWPIADTTSKRDEQRFAKRSYRQLYPNFAFVFFASVEDDFNIYQRVVTLGQSKSPFAVRVIEEGRDAEEPVFPTQMLKSGMAYAQSDIYMSEAQQDGNNPLDQCLFAAVALRDFRSFVTKYDAKGGVQLKTANRYKKDVSSITLIKAGSVFMPKDPSNFKNMIKSSHAEIVGFNRIVIGGEQ
jgi:hypothetical protein